MAVLERVHLPIKEGTEEAFEEKMAGGGLDVLRNAPGCEGVELRRGVEDPSTYLLTVAWDAVGSHIAFTQEAVFADFVEILKAHLSGATDMAHFDEPI
jgi:heme-degrading monooxygenase HmoA